MMTGIDRLMACALACALAGFLLAGSAGASQDSARGFTMPPPVVDLGRPGVLEALARDNPDHYVKIERILTEVARQPPETVPRWMSAQFGAERVTFPALLKTSDPAQRSLAFTLDETRYEAVIRVPARWSFGR